MLSIEITDERLSSVSVIVLIPNIEEIIAEPDYVGQNPKDQSITYVKLFQLESVYIRIAVRITPKKVAFAKSLHLLSTRNAERYIEHGTLKKLDK